jgi:hypothetical protein
MVDPAAAQEARREAGTLWTAHSTTFVQNGPWKRLDAVEIGAKVTWSITVIAYR